MNIDRAIRGSLASLPDTFNEVAFLEALALHGLTLQDSQLMIEKAALDGYVAHVDIGMLRKLPRALESPDDGTAASEG
jgi:hypothetical protein